MRGTPSRPALGLVLLAGAALAGCGLFQPTEPEPPSGVVVEADYTDPDATLATLRLAVEDKGRTTGQTAYLGGLADPDRDGLDFTALHLPEVVQELQSSGVTIPDPWTHALESTFYRKLIGLDGSAYAMSWEVDSSFVGEDRTDAEEAIRNRKYFIQSESGLIAEGYAKLTFRLIPPSRWVIVTWEERPVRSGEVVDFTFSMLRLKP